MIKNPGVVGSPFIYRVKLLHYESSKHYPLVMGEFEYNNLEETVVGGTANRAMSSSLTNNNVQHTASYSIEFTSWEPPQNS